MQQKNNSVTIYKDTPLECQINVLDYLKNWDGFGSWELIRHQSMKDHLSLGNVLLDVGAENGWQSILNAKLVGPSNIILVEPSKRFWANIRRTWNLNFETPPMATIQALISNKTNEIKFEIVRNDFVIKSDEITQTMDYVNIFHFDGRTPEVRIDDLDIKFDSVNIDCEGAEFLIVDGARKTFRENNMKIWISIHPDLSLKHYGIDTVEVIKLMVELGYKNQFLGRDHEEHWYFYK